jgi:hypothetical protein
LGEIEREAKLVITPDDYRRLRGSATVLECREQLNVYLHDPTRLGEGLGYLRVRYESGRDPVATLKIPKSWTGAVREMVEVEALLADLGPRLNPWPKRVVHVEVDLPEEIRGHFAALGISSLRRLGWMRNLRCLVEVRGLGVFELDRTRLPGGSVHHEVEIETHDEDQLRSLLAWVMEAAPSAALSRVGKFSLFLDGARSAHPGWA